MRTYLDASVFLRVLLREDERLEGWHDVTDPCSSVLLRVEVLRAVDRARIRLGRPDAVTADERSRALTQLEAVTLVAIDPVVVERAADPFPTTVGTLDAIHLATALLLREQEPIGFATHDAQLATAARAVGFEVQGA